MNFDDIKSAWNSDSGNNIEVPQNLENLKKAFSPIDKVKKNLRMELLLNLSFAILFFFIPFLVDRLSPMTTVLYYTILILTLFPMSYYFFNFYKFYGKMNKYEFNTKDNLNDAYFELKHFTEIYKVMQHFISPNFMLMGFILGVGHKINRLLDKLISLKDLHHDGLVFFGIVFGAFAIVIVLFYFFINFHINYLYGKYLKQLGEIRDNLKDE